MKDSPFGFVKAQNSPGFLLWQTTITWQRLIKKALEPYEIAHAQFVIMAILLWFLENQYESTQASLVSWSKLDKMTVSQSLKKLANLGLVKRSENPSDTRIKTVILTNKGNALARKLVPLVEGIDAHFFGELANSEQSSLIRVLNKLTKI